MRARIIGVNRPAFARTINETLFLTPDRVVVARTKGESTALNVGFSCGAIVGIVIGALTTLATNLGLIESIIISVACTFGLGGVGAAIGAIIDKARRKEKKEQTLEELLKAENNWVILNSEITKVELKKKWGAIKISIETKDKIGKWNGMGIPEKKKVKLEDYENILRPIFGDKLSVKK